MSHRVQDEHVCDVCRSSWVGLAGVCLYATWHVREYAHLPIDIRSNRTSPEP